MLTPEQFTQAHVAALKEQMGDLEIETPRDLEVQVALKDYRFNFSLERAYYQEYLLEPRAKDELIATFVTSAVESLQMIPGAARNSARFVPMVRRRDWLEAQAVELLHDSFGPDLVVIYAEDRPNSIHYLTAEDIETAGVAREDLRALALDNLLELLTIEEHFEEGVYRLHAGGDYDASLILNGWILEQYQEKVTGLLVVAIPVAGTCLLTGSGNREALLAMKQTISMLSENSDRLLTTQIFGYKGNGKFSIVKSRGEDT